MMPPRHWLLCAIGPTLFLTGLFNSRQGWAGAMAAAGMLLSAISAGWMVGAFMEWREDARNL